MILFLILIIVASIAMGLFILIQNPKGGGLAGNIAGFNSQFMGVKQTTDVLEKGTWIMAVAIAVLSLCSAFFISGSSSAGDVKDSNIRPSTQQTAPAATPPAPGGTTVPATK
ncbi:preprotein translocase subunit SecG [Paraflavitalea soli]|uniref:Protein-export membrane protein SecG n=1 Tax=Paraflavitalea soli TaxID=2315862 RepID=A0A3B7MNL9_9BACT|nr:preprotein translocase subunit SecG [Paraflavitalea soli]AXY74913.1 preprotein translocase subunit SecG [Paraflavitalea soli]